MDVEARREGGKLKLRVNRSHAWRKRQKSRAERHRHEGGPRDPLGHKRGEGRGPKGEEEQGRKTRERQARREGRKLKLRVSSSHADFKRKTLTKRDTVRKEGRRKRGDKKKAGLEADEPCRIEIKTHRGRTRNKARKGKEEREPSV